MQSKIKRFTFLDKQSYIRLYIRIVEAISPLEVLTSREIDVLSTFLSFQGEVAEKSRFSGNFRKEAMEILDMRTAQMTNILKDLREKGIITKSEGRDVVHPLYIPPAEGVELKLILHEPFQQL